MTWNYWLEDDELDLPPADVRCLRRWGTEGEGGHFLRGDTCEWTWSPSTVDFVFGMSDDIWSCGPFGEWITEERAREIAQAHGCPDAV